MKSHNRKLDNSIKAYTSDDPTVLSNVDDQMAGENIIETGVETSEMFPSHGYLGESSQSADHLHLNTEVVKCDKTLPILCSHCGQEFTNLNSLSRHITVHGLPESFSCSACGTPFQDTNQFRSYQMTPTREEVYFCCGCSENFNRKDSSARHDNINHNQLVLTPSAENIQGTLTGDSHLDLL
ncbi:hypothetical protein QAD02_019514 [Eretmocerus hayati]|uniref:Uncharacterized protein n=1 Tax=Eretmocerus hayati TaxID=131215 RepID=A0ACC2PK24_9HYME|nr:hypothetical protein QAD02_019514 [Eretmocerus hayati]